MLLPLRDVVGLPVHVPVPDVEAHQLDAAVVHVLGVLVGEALDERALFDVVLPSFMSLCCCS